jgi:hypothetical protein
MGDLSIAKPEAGEFAAYYGRYIDLVPDGDVIGTLAAQIHTSLGVLRTVSAQDSLKRYQPGKWSLREVVGHVVDTERIFSYRALRFARNDATPLPGFEQDHYIPPARFDLRPWPDLLSEFEALRSATLWLFRGFDPEAWQRRGTASDHPISVRAIAYIVAGHERHHMHMVREKYIA